MNEILEHELPLPVRVSNYLLLHEHFKLHELLDISSLVCLDICRDFRALANSIDEQIRLYPERIIGLRDALESARLRAVKKLLDEKQKHD